MSEYGIEVEEFIKTNKKNKDYSIFISESFL